VLNAAGVAARMRRRALQVTLRCGTLTRGCSVRVRLRAGVSIYEARRHPWMEFAEGFEIERHI